MKALSLHQPWATAVALGLKTEETRSWDTRFSGLLLIHAAKARTRRQALTYTHWMATSADARAAFYAAGFTTFDSLPFGAIIASCCIAWTNPTTGIYLYEHLKLFGDYSAGRYIWGLTHARRIEPPIPCKGRQGLFTVPATLILKDL